MHRLVHRTVPHPVHRNPLLVRSSALCSPRRCCHLRYRRKVSAFALVACSPISTRKPSTLRYRTRFRKTAHLRKNLVSPRSDEKLATGTCSEIAWRRDRCSDSFFFGSYVHLTIAPHTAWPRSPRSNEPTCPFLLVRRLDFDAFFKYVVHYKL